MKGERIYFEVQFRDIVLCDWCQNTTLLKKYLTLINQANKDPF